MGLLKHVLFGPVTLPIAGVRWVLATTQRAAEEEYLDDASVKAELLELQMQLELDEIDEAAFVERESELFARLREIRAYREQMGR